MSSPELFYNQENSASYGGVQLIDFPKDSSTGLKVSQKGLKVLNALPKDKNLNTCFIFGNARSGKSFMMNCLSGSRGLFKVVNSSIPCTQGVQISTHTPDQSELLKHIKTYHDVNQEEIAELQKEQDGDGPSGSPLCAFIDVEGQGDQSATYDTLLATPMLLTSKVVLFNHKGAPTVSHMLSQLGVLARAAERIDLTDKTIEKKDDEGDEDEGDEDEDEDSDEDDDDEDENDSTPKFGHLHVLFRDFAFEGDRDSVYSDLLKQEKIKKKKNKKKKGPRDGNAAIKERNLIRDLLSENFASINVWLFKQPAKHDDIKKHQELPADIIDHEFTDTVKELLATITEQMTSPTKFNGVNLSGPRLGSIICRVCLALNKGGKVNVPSVFRAMEKERIVKQFDLCKKHYAKESIALEEKLPVSKSEMTELLADLTKNVLGVFDEQLDDCALLDEMKITRKNLKEFIDTKNKDVMNINHTKTIKRVHEVLIQESETLKETFKIFFDLGCPFTNSNTLSDKFTELKKQAKKNVEETLGDLANALQFQECRVFAIEMNESNQSYLMFISTKNETALKDSRIDQLEKEMQDQKTKLDEQTKMLQSCVNEEKKKTAKIELEIQRMRKEKEEEEKEAQEAEEEFQRQKEAIDKLKDQKCCIIA